MDATTIGITIVFAIIGAIIGFGFAPMPRNDMMNAQQKKVSSAVGIVYIGVFLAAMILGWDAASWSILICAVVGYMIGTIPAVKEFMQIRFDFYAVNPKKRNRNNKTVK